MVCEAMESYVNTDLDLAQSVIEKDDTMDDLYLEARKLVISRIQDPKLTKKQSCGLVDLMSIAKYFERIGDHATNIAEWVQFALTGKHAED
jgi:phosphate transport system protein